MGEAVGMIRRLGGLVEHLQALACRMVSSGYMDVCNERK
jgi:hypothetical protein